MAFSSGTFSLYTPGNPVVTGTTIASTWANNTLNDIATGLSTCVLKDGTQTLTANIPMSNFKLTGLGAGTASGNSIRYEQVNGVVTTGGDVLVASAAGTFTRVGLGTKGMLLVGQASSATTLSVGANGKIPMARSADSIGLAYVAALNSTIYGLVQSVNSGDATNDTDISAGGAMDATGAYFMVLSSTLTKQSDVAWAVGSGNGGLDTGAVGNSDYYIWLIARSDTGVVDALYSLSSTAPTMPTNYDFKRLIGWVKRSGGTIVAYHAYERFGGGLEYNWDVPTLDINLNNTLTTSRRTDAVKVPLNFATDAHINVALNDASSVTNVWICCPDQTDAAPSATAAPLGNAKVQVAAVTSLAQLKIRTSAAGLIAARSDLATVDLYAASTMGFLWDRRN